MDTDILVLKNGEKNRNIIYRPSGEIILSCDDSEEICLCRGVTDDFDACTDYGGMIDIFAVNTGGGLYHINYSSKGVLVNTVLESRGDSKICSVRVLRINSKIHLFYCLDRAERLLVHQAVELGNYTLEPQIVARIGRKYIFAAAKDEGDNIHVIYSSDKNKLEGRTYVYSTKTYTPPEVIADYDARSLSAVCAGDACYIAFTALQKGRNTVFVCDSQSKELAVAGVHVSMRSEAAIYFDGDKLKTEWIENSMCFGADCTTKLVRGRVSAKGRSKGMIKVRLCDSRFEACYMASNVSGLPFVNPLSFAVTENRQNDFAPKGYEVDRLSQKYIEVLSRKDEPARDFKEDLMMIEASLERLIQLVERALSNSVNNEKEEYNIQEISEEDI